MEIVQTIRVILFRWHARLQGGSRVQRSILVGTLMRSKTRFLERERFRCLAAMRWLGSMPLVVELGHLDVSDFLIPLLVDHIGPGASTFRNSFTRSRHERILLLQRCPICVAIVGAEVATYIQVVRVFQIHVSLCFLLARHRLLLDTALHRATLAIQLLFILRRILLIVEVSLVLFGRRPNSILPIDRGGVFERSVLVLN